MYTEAPLTEQLHLLTENFARQAESNLPDAEKLDALQGTAENLTSIFFDPAFGAEELRQAAAYLKTCTHTVRTLSEEIKKPVAEALHRAGDAAMLFQARL